MLFKIELHKDSEKFIFRRTVIQLDSTLFHLWISGIAPEAMQFF